MPNLELLSRIESNLSSNALLSKAGLQDVYEALLEPGEITIRGLSIPQMMQRSVHRFFIDDRYATNYPKINYSLMLLKANGYI